MMRASAYVRTQEGIFRLRVVDTSHISRGNTVTWYWSEPLLPSGGLEPSCILISARGRPNRLQCRRAACHRIVQTPSLWSDGRYARQSRCHSTWHRARYFVSPSFAESRLVVACAITTERWKWVLCPAEVPRERPVCPQVFPRFSPGFPSVPRFSPVCSRFSMPHTETVNPWVIGVATDRRPWGWDLVMVSAVDRIGGGLRPRHFVCVASILRAVDAFRIAAQLAGFEAR